MARKRIYNHTRFDGGMTDSPRDTSNLTKLAYISHLDIYRDPNQMYVMPGFVSDDDYDSTEHGLRDYDIQAFNTATSQDRIYALGKKIDGTGSKIFVRIYSGTEWEEPSGGFAVFAIEGTADLVDYPFFHYINPEFYYPVKASPGIDIAEHGPNAIDDYDADWQEYDPVSTFSSRFILRQVFTGSAYFSQGSVNSYGLTLITSSGITKNAKSSSLFIRDFATGDYQVGIHGLLTNPRRGQALLWDAASLLADQNIATGKGTPIAIGFPSNIWATVTVSTSVEAEANGKSEMIVRLLNGESPEVVYRLEAISAFNGISDSFSLNDQYQDSMLWYNKAEVKDSEFVQGIWAFGKGSLQSQYGVSLLLNTETLGLVRNTYVNGNAIWFIHNENGSVSRLDNFETGTYDVPATIETLIYGADSPYLKELNGISVVTEDLPSGGSVVVSYRTDEDSAWTTMGTSNTTGSRKHNFTRANGTSIGRFQEIQFRIVITGKTAVKNIMVAVTETEDLPF